MDELPIEIIAVISTYLSPPEFGSFRRTSKRYADTSFDELTARIKGQAYLIAPHSLNTLLDIASHPSIAPKIETLRLTTEIIEYGSDIGEHLADMSLPYDDSSGNLTRRRRELESLVPQIKSYFLQLEPFREGDDIGLLTAILLRLPNIRDIVLGPQPGETSYSPGYGFQTVKHQCGVINDSTSKDFCHIFICDGMESYTKTMWRALACSRKQIRKFSARLWDTDNHLEREDDMIPTQSYQVAGFEKAFSQITTLGLSPHWEYPQTNDTMREDWISNVIKYTPLLENLSLDFQQGLPIDYQEGFEKMAKSTIIPRLQTFELRNAVVNGPDLIYFLDQHSSTLKRTVLEDVDLPYEPWSEFLNGPMKKLAPFSGTLILNRLVNVLAEDDEFDPISWQIASFESFDHGGGDCSEICNHLQRTLTWQQLQDLPEVSAVALGSLRWPSMIDRGW